MVEKLEKKLSKKEELLKMAAEKGITVESQRRSLKELQEFLKDNPLTDLEEVRRNAWR